MGKKAPEQNPYPEGTARYKYWEQRHPHAEEQPKEPKEPEPEDPNDKTKRRKYLDKKIDEMSRNQHTDGFNTGNYV